MTPARVLAIARTDVRVRLSRGSSVALVVALCILAYVMVPDISTGRALMQVNGHRALYNSATIALATSSLCAVLLGLLGFYLISNTVRRDLVTRTGFVIASTPVRNSEYLAGKMLGNATFLSLIVLVYIANVMGMQLLRGEAPIEPLTYATIFLAAVGPAVVVVAACALVFECVRPLSGRIGDVLYFFVWVMLLSIPASTADSLGRGIGAYLDVFGLAFLINAANGQATGDFHAHPEVSIGSSRFDPARAPWHFDGVPWNLQVVETRVAAAALAIPLLVLAWMAFARFDPARVKQSGGGARGALLARLGAPFAPLVRLAHPESWAGPGLARMALGEVGLSIMLHPILLAAAVAAAIAGAAVTDHALRAALLPILFVALIAGLADIPTRDRVARVDGIRGGISHDRALAVPARLLGAVTLALAFVAVPLVRMSVSAPRDALSLAIGAAFLASAAVALGTLSRTPKLFAGLAMLFFYVVMNSPRETEFDFAGWNGAATNGVRVAYFVAAIALAAVAVLAEWHRTRTERS
ncbi:MAG: hypothetical protein ACHQRL_06520 [Gemmatimonadales bacterium]